MKFTLVAVGSTLLMLALWITLRAVPALWIYVVEAPRFTATMFTAAVAGLFLALRGNRVTCGAVLGAAVAALLVSTFPSPTRSLSTWAADLADVFIYRGQLQRMSDESRRRGDSPPLAVIYLNGLGSWTYGLAFDPTGEILLPNATRSAAWVKSSDRTDLSADSLSARHIVGAYYAWAHR